MRIVFSRHAENKFYILAEHGCRLSRKIVERAIINPQHIDYARLPLLIAQIPLDKTHVLRVVYRQENDTAFIITFYPGRRNQYEKE